MVGFVISPSTTIAYALDLDHLSAKLFQRLKANLGSIDSSIDFRGS